MASLYEAFSVEWRHNGDRAPLVLCLVLHDICCIVTAVRLMVSIAQAKIGLNYREATTNAFSVVASVMLAYIYHNRRTLGFYILYCPVMYLMFINHKLYRKVTDALFAVWELYPVALFQCCCGTKIHHFGDFVNPDENTIMLMNHRTRVDWNYVWIALYHACQIHSTDVNIERNQQDWSRDKDILDVGGKSKLKFVLKDEIKLLPGLGWIMQLNFFLYVKRKWREDELALTQFTEYYKKLDYDLRVVLFPEGTDLSEENRRRNSKYALENNLPDYNFVLLPRTTGWFALCSRLRECGLTSVYDVTVAYDSPAQSELDLLQGKIPSNVYFHFKRYAIDQIPEGEIPLKNWLSDRWREKDISLKEFHNNGNFIDAASNKPPVCRTSRSMFVAKVGFIFWIVIKVIFTYAMFSSALFRYWIVYHSLLFMFVTWKFGGFHNVQYKLFEKSSG